ncbi:MAG TPA: cytochrome c3 family protein [Anaerolineae bacterium]|nr:cytochrome c3 family protein [Anaerolineae bacterium]
MKKKILTLTIMTACIAMVALFCGPGYASVSGPCVDCHTMHNSQGGAVMATGTTAGDAAYGSLTRGTCGGCHETSTADPLEGGYPRVKTSSSGDTVQLAGGYFTATSGQTDNHGNTEHSIGSTVEPAGYNSAGYVNSTDWYVESNGLKCAGNSGCHGNETDTDPAKAIAGGHHANTLKGGYTGYRMLQIYQTAVIGTGASDYEKALNSAPSADDPRNYYSATADADGGSISRFCGKCHGDFHGNAGSGNTGVYNSAWVRHPTDALIPTTWEIQTLTNYTFLDWKSNPVGTVNAVAPADDNMYVTCLSCHRAHGSANADILRFAYADQCADGSSVNGCLGCHDKQR